jgi:hypothetical protein
MDYLYIDEKGPQETIRMTTPYDEEKKIKLGNDNMYVYVADLIKINEERLLEHSMELNHSFVSSEHKSQTKCFPVSLFLFSNSSISSAVGTTPQYKQSGTTTRPPLIFR